MATLAEIRAQYPQYRDVPDRVLADGLYQKFYSDVPREEFDRRLGMAAPAAAAPAEPVSGDGDTGLVAGLTRGFTGAVKQLGPTAGAGIEAAGITTGIPAIERAGTAVREMTESETPAPDLVRLRDFFQKPFTFIGEQVGAGVGSTLPSLVGGAAGAGLGALTGPAAPVASPALMIAGAGGPALLQNTGDLFQQLQEEGVDRERAAKVASIWGPVLTVPDVFSASRLLKPFLGTAVTDLSTKGIARAIATRMKQGATVEGITELGQNVGQEAIAAIESGKPDLVNRAERVATGAIAGGLTGGVTGAGGAAVERMRGAPAPAAPPPSAAGPQESAAPAPPPEGTPPVGTVLGLAEGDSAPFRAQVDGYSDDGRFVFLRDEDGERITVRAADLPGMAQTAPPPSGRAGDPTSVPTPPPDETPPVSEDEARFYDQFEADSIPAPPPRPEPPTPQLDLGDPARADAMLAGAQRQKVAVEAAVQRGALTPEDGARRLRVLDDVIADAEQMRARVAAAPARPDAASVAAAAEVSDAEKMGGLGQAAGEPVTPEPIDAPAMAAARDLEARQRAGALGQQAGAPRPVEAPDAASIEAARKVGAREEMARMQAPARAAAPVTPVSARKPKPPQTFMEWLSGVGLKEGDPEINDLGEVDAIRNWHRDKRFRKRIVRPDGLSVQEMLARAEREGFIGTGLGARAQGAEEVGGEAQQQYGTASLDDGRNAVYQELVDRKPVVRVRDREAQADLLQQQAAVADAGEFAARYGDGAEGDLRRRAEMLGIETWDTAETADLQEQVAERLAIMEVDTVEQALAAMATVDAPTLTQQGYTNDFDLTDDIAQEGPAVAERAGPGVEAESEIPGFEVGPEDRADAERPAAPTGEQDRRVDRSGRARYDDIAAQVRRENPGMPEQAVREEVLDRMAEGPATEATDQGDNFILGADTTGSAEQAQAAAQARAQAEMRARQQQSKIRRGGQESVADQEGGLFDTGRDQGDLLAPKRQPMRRPKKQGRDAIEAQNARILAAATNKLGENLNESTTRPEMMASVSRPAVIAATGPLRPMYRLGNLWTYVVQATAVAARDRAFARLFGAIQGQHHTETELIKDGGEKLDSVLRLNDKQAKVFNQIAEYLTLSGKPPKRVGKTLVLRTEPVSLTEDVKQEDGSIKQVRRVLTPENYKPGDILEADAATTKAIYDTLDYGQERWMPLHGSLARLNGYMGEFTRAGINKALAEAKRPRDKLRAEIAKVMFDAAEEGRRKAYFPLMRYGDTAIVIKPKPGSAANKSGGVPSVKDGRVEFVQSEGPLSGLLSGTATGRGRVQKRMEELKKRFPPDQYTMEAKYLQTAKDVDALDLPMIDRLMTATNLRDAKQAAEAYKSALNLKTTEYETALKELARALPGAAKKQALEKMKAGLMRQRDAVPGYETDFRRALMDYNRSSAGIIARRIYRVPIEEAKVSVFGGVDDEGVKSSAQSHPTVQKFAQRYLDYLDSPEHAAFRTGRWLGFYMNIFGSFGSAAVNGISTATITAPQIAAWSPAGAAGVVPAFRRAIRGMTWGPTGFTIDPARIPGMNANEAAAIKKAAQQGVLAPALGLEFQGTDVGSNIPGGPLLNKTLRKYSDIGSSLFNVVEQLNRYVAFMASYRAAQSPAARKRFERQYAKNERVQDIKRTEGLTPATIARFMVEQTQFIGGQFDRPSILRGAGGVALQFKTFPVNYTRILVENLTRQGPQGKFAAGLMLLGLFSFAGLLGLPFGQDALDIVEIANKALGGVDEDLEGALRRFIADIYGGERREGESEEAYQKRRDHALVAAEVWMRGPIREFLGFEGGTRFGVGEVGPEIGDIVQAIPLLAGTIGRVQEAQRRSASGQDVGAAVAIASPFVGKGAADAARGLIQYPTEGYQTQRGRMVVDPTEITYGQMALKAMGFQPAEMARKTERAFAQRRELTGDAQVRTNRISELGNLYSQAIKAQEAGDDERAQKLLDRMVARLDVFSREHAEGRGPPPPDRKTIQSRAMENLDPERRARRGPKERRQDALDVPYVD